MNPVYVSPCSWMISLLSHQTISLACFFLMACHALSLSSLLCHSFHLPLPICTVFLYSSLLLLIHCVVFDVCVCHSAKILLTCGSACLPYVDCSFILALAAHGMCQRRGFSRGSMEIRPEAEFYDTESNSERIFTWFMSGYRSAVNGDSNTKRCGLMCAVWMDRRWCVRVHRRTWQRVCESEQLACFD